ncbi:acyl-CoA N-acyltransferase [Daldinia caldariorum]|uniref:acyl-CoA N-acyltransferase n=1 Tax=Daldinia caldariorum TaxID=326644 RepID=UPI0020077C11|nr:acyl-CoA N-acyltransferase [Daldinia caldariorum]KAI1469483.1 acyl-CoA N-acyltransferase [Daldinia caldariorum]
MADNTTTTPQSPPTPTPTPTPIVTTDKCIIRAYVPSDAEAMAAAANYPEIAQYMRNTFPHPYTLESARYWIEQSTRASPTVNFGIFTPGAAAAEEEEQGGGGGTFAGAIGLIPRADIEYRTWEVGYWVAMDHWGKGIATSALKAFSAWAFEQFPELLRIEAGVFSENVASLRVLERAGFTREGLRRQAICKKGKIIDQVTFSLLRDDLRDLH